jgi:hypothetical protein
MSGGSADYNRYGAPSVVVFSSEGHVAPEMGTDALWLEILVYLGVNLGHSTLVPFQKLLW